MKIEVEKSEAQIKKGTKTTDANGSTSVTFDRPFDSVPYVSAHVVAGSGTIYCPVITLLSANGFNCTLKQTNGTAIPANQTVHWVAISA